MQETDPDCFGYLSSLIFPLSFQFHLTHITEKALKTIVGRKKAVSRLIKQQGSRKKEEVLEGGNREIIAATQKEGRNRKEK